LKACLEVMHNSERNAKRLGIHQSLDILTPSIFRCIATVKKKVVVYSEIDLDLFSVWEIFPNIVKLLRTPEEMERNIEKGDASENKHINFPTVFK